MTDISFFPNNINTSSLERLLELINFTTTNHQRQNALIFCQSLPANFWRKCMETLPSPPALSFFSAPAAWARVVGVHRSPGAHNPDCATSMRSCHGVFTDQFTFRTFLARILNIFKFHKPVSKTYRPKNDFCLLITFSFPFWYPILRICW